MLVINQLVNRATLFMGCWKERACSSQKPITREAEDLVPNTLVERLSAGHELPVQSSGMMA